MGRAAALLGVLAALVVWYEVAPHVDVETQSFQLTLNAQATSFGGGWHQLGHASHAATWAGTRDQGTTGWTGHWTVHASNGSHYTVVLTQTGRRVTGRIRKSDGANLPVSGTTTGRTLRFDETAGGWSLWPNILLIAFVLIPATFMLVWLTLPLWDWRLLDVRFRIAGRQLAVPIALGFVALAWLCSLAHFPVGSNFCKLGALTLFGWWFLGWFEDVSWVVIVALLIPWVDIYSVWRGPTKALTNGAHQSVFSALSIAFIVPSGGAARLGLPDVLFYAVFLAASVRFRLRPFATFVCMTLALGVTIVCATWWDVAGLPALPGISLGFLLPNADLLVRRLRLRPGGDRADVALD